MAKHDTDPVLRDGDKGPFARLLGA